MPIGLFLPWICNDDVQLVKGRPDAIRVSWLEDEVVASFLHVKAVLEVVSVLRFKRTSPLVAPGRRYPGRFFHVAVLGRAAEEALAG